MEIQPAETMESRVPLFVDGNRRVGKRVVRPFSVKMRYFKLCYSK